MPLLHGVVYKVEGVGPEDAPVGAKKFEADSAKPREEGVNINAP
jgi:hypothetical protein